MRAKTKGSKKKEDDVLKGLSKVLSVFLKDLGLVLKGSISILNNVLRNVPPFPAPSQPDARAVPSTIMVERSYPGGDPVTERTFEIMPFVTTPASVTAGFGLTIPLAAYASGRVYVQVTLPCYKEEVADALLKAKGIVEDEVSVEAEKIYAKKDELSGQARPAVTSTPPGEAHAPEVPGAV